MTPADFLATLRELIAVACQTGPRSEATERGVRELGSVFAQRQTVATEQEFGKLVTTLLETHYTHIEACNHDFPFGQVRGFKQKVDAARLALESAYASSVQQLRDSDALNQELIKTLSERPTLE